MKFQVLLFIGSLFLAIAPMESIRSQDVERPDVKPLLLANYYTWYRDGSHEKAPWWGWTNKGEAPNAKSLSKQREGFPAPSSALTPLVGWYDSWDKGVSDWHVDLALSAGLDGFLVDWWAGHYQRDEAAEAAIIASCEEKGLPWAILDERAQFHKDFDSYCDWVLEAMERYFPMEHYLRIDGEPLWYLYQIHGSPKLSVESFQKLREKAEAKFGPIFWVLDHLRHDRTVPGKKKLQEEWLAVEELDCFVVYSTFSNFRANRYEELSPVFSHITQQAHAAGKKMMLPVHPGHDNSFFRPADDFYDMKRRDGDTLRDFLKAGTQANADFLMVTSWNEWPEATVVEPAEEWADPYQYLRIISDWKGKEFQEVPVP